MVDRVGEDEIVDSGVGDEVGSGVSEEVGSGVADGEGVGVSEEVMGGVGVSSGVGSGGCGKWCGRIQGSWCRGRCWYCCFRRRDDGNISRFAQENSNGKDSVQSGSRCMFRGFHRREPGPVLRLSSY